MIHRFSEALGSRASPLLRREKGGVRVQRAQGFQGVLGFGGFVGFLSFRVLRVFSVLGF